MPGSSAAMPPTRGESNLCHRMTVHEERPAEVEVEPPTWSTWREAALVVLHPPHLRRTVTIALVVGTLLFCINQLDVVLRGGATAAVWVKSVVTYVVPFAVSNAGVLVGSRRAHD
jgi:hypothetical protein